MLGKLLALPLSLLLAATVLSRPSQAADDSTLLLRQPTLSADRLAFVYGGDLWVADRKGGQPRRLTSHASVSSPYFSPDGKWIAFSAAYDGNTDVYVVPAAGGQPKRLTFHPAPDEVDGWSADGKRILFASPREIANSRSRQLYEVPLDGGYARKVMEAVAVEAAWSPDGKRLAYRPYRKAYEGTSGWRFHRGGDTTPIWIIDPATQAEDKVPHVNASDSNPAWLGDEVLFISDRSEGAANIFAYNFASKSLRQLTHENEWDVRSFAALGQSVVYEAGGRLKELDLASGSATPLKIVLAAEEMQERPQWKDASHTIESARLSATGKRIVVTARGDVFTVPVKDGSTRNLTASPGVRDRDGLWSHDGKQVAYVTDLGMQHALAIRDQDGQEKPKLFPLGKVGYFSLLDWSPDGKVLIYQDNHLNLYAFDIDRGKSSRIDTSLRRAPFRVAFSPDSHWLAYTVTGRNYLSQIRLHEIASARNTDLTDGLSDASDPVFSADGILYFTASINSGPTRVGLDMSTQERSLRRGIYAAVLAADGKSPLLPKTGDEEPAKKGKDKDKDKDKKDDGKPKPLKIDFVGLQQRIVGLPVAERRYDSLHVGSDGALYYLERAQPGISLEPPAADTENNAELYRFDFTERKTKSLKSGLSDYDLSADGKKLLLVYGNGRLETADAGDKLETKPVDLGQLRVHVDPKVEWRQIFDEAWWMEKEFFYDPNMHGLDWDAVYKRYLPLLDHVARREDLNQLLIDMIAELQVGHNRVSGGDLAQERPADVGLLGADYTVDHDRYRVKTVYAGDRWNPFLAAPLAAPGAQVKEGEYILAVNGQPVDASQDLSQWLENTVGKQVTLTVGPNPSDKGSRKVVVQPIANETALRQWQWIEHNRAYVAEKSGGKLAYVYLPDTAGDGFKYFNRLFFAQIDKPAAIIDERKNNGGQAANYITEILGRPYLAGWKDRDGLVFNTPGGGIYGPKVMLIDQDAGSGGDFLPYAFKRLKLGPLVGTRTWGGLIGISTNPPLIDGASLTVPFFRFFTPDGEWHVENEGVTPDIEVELDPATVNKGGDPQLDAAIAQAMKQLESFKPVERSDAPPMPRQPGK